MDNNKDYGSITEFDNSRKTGKQNKCAITFHSPKTTSSIQDNKRNTTILLIGLTCCICSSFFIEAGLGPSIGRITYGNGYQFTIKRSVNNDYNVIIEFHDSKNLSWYSTTFLLCSAVFQLLAVRISDCLGRRRIFLYAIILMFLSSLIGGFAWEPVLFLVCRVLQGCASGICQSLVVTVIIGIILIAALDQLYYIFIDSIHIDLFPLEKRVKYQPIINASYGITTILAPVLSGIYVDHLTWRCTFWTTTLITIPSFIIIFLLLDIPLQPEQHLSKDNLKFLVRRIDPIGCLLASVGVILFLTSLNVASMTPSLWLSPFVLGMFISSILVGICFIIFEKWVTPWPLFPSAMVIGNRNLVFSYVLVFINGWHYILFDLLVLIEYQTAYLQTPTNAGLALIPPTISFTVSSLAASRLLRWLGDIKPIGIIGNAITCIGALMMIFVQQVDSSSFVRVSCTVVYAMGIGFSGQVVGLSTQMILEENKHAVLAASSMALVRCIVGVSGAVCTAVSLAILLTELTWRIQQTPPEIYAILRDSGVIENYTRITSIHSETALNVIRSIYLDSFKTVYYFFLAWSIVGIVTAMVIKVPKIKKS